MSVARQVSPPFLVHRDWKNMSIAERIRHIEVEGYVVLPNLLTPEQIARLKSETAQLLTKAVDYSIHQQVALDVQYAGGAISGLIANPPLIEFLKVLFGDEIIMMTYDFARSSPGHPGISLHSDGQPYGSKIFGYEHSCPTLVRVLYYLDDLTPEVSPFKVVPRSHLSMHADANPYNRYTGHPEEQMVTVNAGDAVLINQRVIHGNYPNVGNRSRELLAIAYRPAWAGPVAEVESWDAEKLKALPEPVRALMGDRNKRIWAYDAGNKPANMRSEAPGISPSRWGTPV